LSGTKNRRTSLKISRRTCSELKLLKHSVNPQPDTRRALFCCLCPHVLAHVFAQFVS
jgi:hypothetical protein